MMKLIIGGSGSGKSAYAEGCMVSLSGGMKKYYIATMQTIDAESKRKIDRHRMLRSGKGFITIEQPVDIQEAARQMEAGEKTGLIECISNLTANEMFEGGIPKRKETVTEKIVGGIGILKEQLTHLVIVSSNVFEDGRTYDQSVMEYIRAMGQINERLAVMADEVEEVVAGIPVAVKSFGQSAGCAQESAGSLDRT